MKYLLSELLPNGKLINYNNLLYYGDSFNHLIQLALQSNVDNISSIINNKSQIIVKSDVKNNFQPTNGILYTIDTSHQFFILMGYVISRQINDEKDLYWSNGSSGEISLRIGKYWASNNAIHAPFVIIYSNNMVVSITYNTDGFDINGFINTYSNPCIYFYGKQMYDCRFDYYSFTFWQNFKSSIFATYF